jgi:CheY-like chemotaxis protein
LDEADLRELVAVFVLDAPGRLGRIELRLDAFERAPGPSEQATAIAAAALEAHSLSGAAKTLRLEPLATDAERLELLLRDDVGRGGRYALASRARGLLGAIAAIVAGLESEQETPAPARVAGPAQGTVLHVEDNPVNVKLIERALARRPAVRLLTATRAETGFRLARAERPDLILLDLHLPDGSGGELLTRLRADPATRDVPVVVVSGDAPSRNGDSLRGLGIREYLPKPVDIGRLLELVDELAPLAPGGGQR